MNRIVTPRKKLNGLFKIPGDKSISHRAVMIGAIAEGTTYIKGFLAGDDCISTIQCFQALGVQIKREGTDVRVLGKGLHGLRKPVDILDIGNSGTSIRLISGILSGQKFESIITGDASICSRPMDRIMEPLRHMGAQITGSVHSNYAPLIISPSKLKGIDYTMPVASAQVKSCLILAGLYADGVTTIVEKDQSRDHTEIMLNHFGATIKKVGNKIQTQSVDRLFGREIDVPSDISSAAFLIVGALILDNSEVFLENIGMNENRIGIITALKKMGGNIELSNERVLNGEPVADIRAWSSDLKAITIEGEIIPKMIDEIPIFVIAALFAEGTTVIKDAEELKVKESNRIKAMATELSKMGADITQTSDGMIIKSGNQLKGATVDSYCDHRIAMSMAIAAMAAEGETEIINGDCVNISFPDFYTILEK